MYSVENRTTIQVSEELRRQLKILASKRDLSYQELLEDMISVFQELDRRKTIVSIPSKLSEKVKEKIQDTDINSVSEYITFVLRVILIESSENKDASQLDEEKIKVKLKKLGYL